MELGERINLIRVLDRAIKAIKENNIKDLKDLSNQTIHDATIIQDEYSISTAVIIYALSKIYERQFNYSHFKGWKELCLTANNELITARDRLQKNDLAGFDASIKGFLGQVTKIDKKLKVYIQDVLHKAKINKASRLYEHGLSIGRTASLLGVSRYELMDYIGKTYIADVQENKTITAKKRLETARGIFS